MVAINTQLSFNDLCRKFLQTKSFIAYVKQKPFNNLKLHEQRAYNILFRWKTTLVIIIVVTWRVQTEEETTEACIVCSFNPCKLLNNQKETLYLMKTTIIHWIYSHHVHHNNPLMIENKKYLVLSVFCRKLFDTLNNCKIFY